MLTRRQINALHQASADEKAFAQILAIIEEVLQQPLPVVEMRYESIFAALVEGVLVYAPDGRLVACNESARRMLRLTDQETGEPALLFSQFAAYDETGRELTLADDPFALALQKGARVQDQIIRLVVSESQQHWLQINAVPLYDKPSGTPTAVVISFNDITPRKQTEAALRQSEEKFQLITQHLRQALHIRDVNTRQLLYLSDNIYELTGLTREQLVADPDLLAQYIHPDDVQRVADVYMDAVRTQTPFVISYRVCQPNGDVRWLRVNEYFVFDEAGSLSKMVGITEDITREKQAEMELERLNDELEQRVRERTAKLEDLNKQLLALTMMRDQFIGNISHELRTPLTNFNLYLRLLQARPENSERYYAVLNQETERLAKIVDNLLIISRLDREKLILQQEVVHLSLFMDTLYQEWHESCREKELTMTFAPLSLEESDKEASDWSGYVLADKAMLKQALDVLLANACQYTPSGGKIALQVTTTTAVVAELSDDEKTWCIISVEDNGLGFTPESEAHLFERFFRGEAPRIARTAGTGLGLSIAYEIVKRHKGRIVPYSGGLHRGARFEVWLPLVSPHNG